MLLNCRVTSFSIRRASCNASSPLVHLSFSGFCGRCSERCYNISRETLWDSLASHLELCFHLYRINCFVKIGPGPMTTTMFEGTLNGQELFLRASTPLSVRYCYVLRVVCFRSGVFSDQRLNQRCAQMQCYKGES